MLIYNKLSDELYDNLNSYLRNLEKENKDNE